MALLYFIMLGILITSLFIHNKNYMLIISGIMVYNTAFAAAPNSQAPIMDSSVNQASKDNIPLKVDSDFITMTLKDGPVILQLCPNKAPNHVQRIKDLTQERFYDGLTFHRVIDNFMVQTGDPSGSGSGGSSKPNLQAEFNNLKHKRGVISMARTNDPNSANSQFFIMLADNAQLDGQYTAFGKVVYGMEKIDQIKKGDPNNNGVVMNPDRIISMNLGKPDNIVTEVFACE